MDAVRSLLGDTLRGWREDKAPRLAAALAYYTAFSLGPLLILAMSIAGLVIGDSQQIRDEIVVQVESTIGPQAAATITTLLDSTAATRQGVLAGVIGIAMLLLGATGVFGQLKDALNIIWEVETEGREGFWGMIHDRFLSLTMVAGMAFLLLVSLMISAAISFVQAYMQRYIGELSVFIVVLNLIVSVAVITLVFAVIFKVLPDTDVAWRDVWVGAFATAIMFTIGKELLGLYLGRSAVSSAYGAAGSLIVILAWVYYSAQILFFGAEFTWVYARRRQTVARLDRGSPSGAAAHPTV